MRRLCLPILLIATGCVLSGCAEYRARVQARMAAQQEAINQADDAQCRQYGAVPGSDGYTACRMNLANNHRADEAARQQAYQNMIVQGAQMMQPPPAPPPPQTDEHVCIAPNNVYYRCP